MSEALSSDILEVQFGPVTVEVLSQVGSMRIIRTRAADGRVLELSKVTFKDGAARMFPEVNDDMSAGRSMGKAFRDHDVPFKRLTRAVYDFELPEAFRGRFGTVGAATVAEVSVLAGRDPVPYADILEVYSPAVDWPEPGVPARQAIRSRLKSFDKLLTELGY